MKRYHNILIYYGFTVFRNAYQFMVYLKRRNGKPLMFINVYQNGDIIVDPVNDLSIVYGVNALPYGEYSVYKILKQYKLKRYE